MKKSLLFKFVVCLFAVATIVSSCAKENKDVIEETVEDINPVLLITINGVTNQYDAYAAYCNDNGVEALSVSNNPLLLDTLVDITNFEEDDFLVYYRNDGTTITTMGGATFVTDMNGQPFTTVSLDSDADITIDEANSTFVQGSMSGTFFVTVPGPNATTADYSVEFLAEVDPNLVALFCY